MSKHVLKKGYTLIEILVVLTILGITFSLGYANFRDYSRKQVLESFARKFRADIRLAQEDAMAGRKPEGCAGLLDGYLVTVGSGSYVIQSDCSGGSTDSKTIAYPDDISISPNLNFTFKSLTDGVSFSTGAGSQIFTFLQASTGNTVTITITSGGKIK